MMMQRYTYLCMSQIIYKHICVYKHCLTIEVIYTLL
nr:MAG TPA: hypothetical protein [Caudoviricetes sp.]